MKRVISLLMVLILALGLLAGCDGDNKSSDSNNADASGNVDVGGLVSKADVNYFDAEGASAYRIIRQDGNTDMNSITLALSKSMKEVLGVNVRNDPDSKDGTDVYEILVGETNRPETQTAKQYLVGKTGGRYNDYVICTIGKKIVIYSDNLEVLQTAVDYFLANYVKKDGVKGGIEYSVKADGEFKSITVNGVEVGLFDFVRPHYNSSYLTEVEMQEIQNLVFTQAGYKMNIVHDTETADKVGEYEIIVGDTTREGTEKITGNDQYKITVSGKKVYINGGSAHATAIAVSEFGKMLQNGNVTDASSVTGSYETTIATYDKSKEFYRAWGDDFDGTQVNSDNWDLVGPDRNYAEGANGKTSVRSNNPSDVFCSDGKFYICARQDEEYYYGGMLRTEGIMRFKYGYVEMSAIIPHGEGFWVALWTDSNDSNASTGSGSILGKPEIDIMECFGNSNSYAANCHSWPKNSVETGWVHTSLDREPYANQKKYSSVDEGKKLGDDFHTYGFLWDETKMAFSCDGDLFFTYDITTNPQDIETFNHSMFLIISFACGFASTPGLNSMTENPDEWQNTNKFIIDWIHIYQKNDGKHELYD